MDGRRHRPRRHDGRLDRRTGSVPPCVARRRDRLDGLAARLHWTTSYPFNYRPARGAIRPQLVAGMVTLPLLLPALIPLMAMLAALYPWARADAAMHLDNRFYLNLPFFIGRFIVYLIVWFGLAELILRALRRPAPDLALARLAPPGLILLAITVTYAAIDMTMSLDPRFVSSIYGLIEIF